MQPDNENPQLQPAPKKRIFGPLLLAIVLILIAVIVWHLLFPVFGITLAFSSAALAAVIFTVMILCISILLFFIFTGIGLLLLSLFACIWVVAILVFFPVIFPILIPLLIILLFIAFIRKKRKNVSS